MISPFYGKIAQRQENVLHRFSTLKGTEEVSCDCCKRTFSPDKVRISKWLPRTVPDEDTKLIWCQDCMLHFGAPMFKCPHAK
uniref:Uncharacterized protein n=1 Tax=viral metagenome TaxID=1070528 RepID=A0A6C0CGS3_9ZZZZ